MDYTITNYEKKGGNLYVKLVAYLEPALPFNPIATLLSYRKHVAIEHSFTPTEKPTEVSMIDTMAGLIADLEILYDDAIAGVPVLDIYDIKSKVTAKAIKDKKDAKLGKTP